MLFELLLKVRKLPLVFELDSRQLVVANAVLLQALVEPLEDCVLLLRLSENRQHVCVYAGEEDAIYRLARETRDVGELN